METGIHGLQDLFTCVLVYVSTALLPKYPRIRFGGFHQLLVRANRGDPAFAQYDNEICPADLGQAMRDNKCGPAARRV